MSLDLLETAVTVASGSTVRIRQLPPHITASKDGLRTFLSLFGEVGMFGVVAEPHAAKLSSLPAMSQKLTTSSVEAATTAELPPQPLTVLVRYSAPRQAATAKACLDYLRFEGKALDCGWLLDDRADELFDDHPALWYAQERPARRKKAARTETRSTAAADELDDEFNFSCCLLSNAFLPAEERAAQGDDWAAILREEMLNETGALHPQAVVVDDWTDKGRVLIKFVKEEQARRCVADLHGRAFGERIVQAHVISVAQAELILSRR
jgi:hypothetical protein